MEPPRIRPQVRPFAPAFAPALAPAFAPALAGAGAGAVVGAVAVVVALGLAGFDAQATELRVEKTAHEGEVRLAWDDGTPVYSVYRSTAPWRVAEPANLLGQTSAEAWVDAPPWADIQFYSVLGSECTEQPDLPDLAFEDTNCDGLDGDIAGSIFVDASGGNDANPGTPAAPKRTLAAASEVARRAGKVVLVAEGTYPESVVLRNGVGLYGGYRASAGWSRAADAASRIAGGTTAIFGFHIAMPTDLQLLAIEAGDASEPGGSSYGVRLVHSDGVVLESCSIASGWAVGGTDGVGGAAGSDGAPGECGSLGGQGGNGGAGAAAGGRGGNGGTPGGTGEGGQSVGGSQGGSPGYGGDCSNDPGAGQNGGSGVFGSPGPGGEAAAPHGRIFADAWAPWISAKGRFGTGGQGGSGGGAQCSAFMPFWPIRPRASLCHSAAVLTAFAKTGASAQVGLPLLLEGHEGLRRAWPAGQELADDRFAEQIFDGDQHRSHLTRIGEAGRRQEGHSGKEELHRPSGQLPAAI